MLDVLALVLGRPAFVLALDRLAPGSPVVGLLSGVLLDRMLSGIGVVVTRSQKIRACLNEGACTAHEVAAICELPIRSARVGLWLLTNTGQARHAGFSAPEGRLLKLYALTPRGEEIFERRSAGDCEAPET